jgi:hypothetical protein
VVEHPEREVSEAGPGWSDPGAPRRTSRRAAGGGSRIDDLAHGNPHQELQSSRLAGEVLPLWPVRLTYAALRMSCSFSPRRMRLSTR